MMSETQELAIKIAFDTSVLIDWHKRPEEKEDQLKALEAIFQTKKTQADGRWYFIYLDAVRREIGGPLLDHLAREAEIQDILPCFDQRVSLSRFPMSFPVMFVGESYGKSVQDFRSMGISVKDSVVLADAAWLNCRFLVTTDGKCCVTSTLYEMLGRGTG